MIQKALFEIKTKTLILNFKLNQACIPSIHCTYLVPSSGSLDNYCCRTQPMVDFYPNPLVLHDGTLSIYS
jgi:hypothetical protein